MGQETALDGGGEAQSFPSQPCAVVTPGLRSLNFRYLGKLKLDSPLSETDRGGLQLQFARVRVGQPRALWPQVPRALGCALATPG